MIPTINKTNIERFFTFGLIAILVIIILFERSCTGHKVSKPEPTVETKIDTVWKTKTDTIVKPVKVYYASHPVVPNIPAYQSSENIDTCKARFQKLLKDFITRRVYKDTIKLDQLGTIEVTDTVWLNKLQHRTCIQNIKIPTVEKTVTITKPADPVRQLYIGGNIFGEPNKIQLLTPGILYKTKQDHIYQVNVGINFDGTVTYGVGAYWKIKLK